MTDAHASFAEFKRVGWEDPDIVLRYDEHMSRVTSQCIPQLLAAAEIGVGSCVLDIATGGG